MNGHSGHSPLLHLTPILPPQLDMFISLYPQTDTTPLPSSQDGVHSLDNGGHMNNSNIPTEGLAGHSMIG